MTRKRDRSLRGTILAVSLTALISVWLFSVAILVLQSRASVAKALEMNDREVVLVGELVGAFFSERMSEIRRFASLAPYLAAQSGGELETYFADFPNYENILILDRRGIVIRTMLPGAQVDGFDYSSQEFFKAARENEIALSAPHVSLETGGTIVTGSIRGGEYTVAVDIDVEKISEMIGRIPAGPYGFVSILDRYGRYVYDRDLTRVITKQLDHDFQDRFGTGGLAGRVRYTAERDGRLMTVTAAPEPSTGWNVLVYLDTALEIGEDLRYLWISVGILVLALLGAAFLSWRGVLTVSRDLSGFISVTDRIARGELTAEPKQADFQEFKALGANFDVMVRAVAERESALMELNARLEEKVALRTASLEKALAELKASQEILVTAEKMTALGRIAAGIAHELNTPFGILESVISRTEKTLNVEPSAYAEHWTVLPPPYRRYLVGLISPYLAGSDTVSLPTPRKERAYRAEISGILTEAGAEDGFAVADRLISLGIYGLTAEDAVLFTGAYAENLLTAIDLFLMPLRSTKIASAAIKQASQVTQALKTYFSEVSSETDRSFPVLPQIQAAITLLRERIRGSAEIALELDGSETAIGRVEDVQRIWFNLLSNAAFAITDGGGIRVWAEKRKADGETLRVHVEDSGCGIPESLHERVFSPFFSTRPIGEGSGLGLDIALRLARSNGGDIEFQSRPGLTDFTVTLRSGSLTN